MNLDRCSFTRARVVYDAPRGVEPQGARAVWTGRRTEMRSDAREEEVTEGMFAMTMAAWPRFVEDAESDEDEDGVCSCPLFTADGDESLPKRNLDALFASTPTLPKKRSMSNASVDGDDSGGELRPLSADRSGPGGATAAELAWERTAQVRSCRFFLVPKIFPETRLTAPGTHPKRIAKHTKTRRG